MTPYIIILGTVTLIAALRLRLLRLIAIILALSITPVTFLLGNQQYFQLYYLAKITAITIAVPAITVRAAILLFFYTNKTFREFYKKAKERRDWAIKLEESGCVRTGRASSAHSDNPWDINHPRYDVIRKELRNWEPPIL